MERYDSYKDSGVKWLGQIPSHWDVLPGLAVVKENKEKNSKLEFNTVLSLSYGNIIIKKDINEGLVPAEYNTYQIVKPGYIIIRCTDLQNDKTSLRTGLVKNECIITSAYLGLVVDRKYNAPYIHYFLHTWDITKEIYRHGSGLRQSLSWLDLKRLPILLPPIAEQDAIVTYLDTATAKIDAAILQQQKMIDLLKERKQIIINSAVTRGLDKNVKMKDSGVEWIGEIPEHWEVVPMKYCVRIKNGMDYKHIQTESGIPVIGSGGQFAYASDYMYDGEVVFFGRKGTVDRPLYFNGKFWAVDTMFYTIPNNKILGKYLYYQGLTIPYKYYSTSTALPSMTQSDLGNNPICLPTINEQNEIVNYLDAKCKKNDRAITNCDRQIALLQERKQIIINDVVTGKMKVL